MILSERKIAILILKIKLNFNVKLAYADKMFIFLVIPDNPIFHILHHGCSILPLDKSIMNPMKTGDIFLEVLSSIAIIQIIRMTQLIAKD